MVRSDHRVERNKKITSLALENKSYEQIGAMYGISRQRIEQIVHYKPKGAKLDNMSPIIIDALNAGTTKKEIADALGIDYNYLTRWIRDNTIMKYTKKVG